MSFLSPVLDGIYDVIVIGGGTAGLVIANRLSQDSNTRVLVLEEGPHHSQDPKVDNPELASSTWADPHYDHSFTTIPQVGQVSHTLDTFVFDATSAYVCMQIGLNNRQLDVCSGRGLGGSSAINLNTFGCPATDLFDYADGELGISGWNHREIQRCLRKIYALDTPSESQSRELGLSPTSSSALDTSGPVKVSYPKKASPLAKAWLERFEELGYPIKNDPITKTGVGGFINAYTIDSATGTRSYAASAFCSDSVRQRTNLVVLTSAYVEKIRLHRTGDSVTATGVQYFKAGIRHIAHTSKQVVLAAGTLHSPKILEFSGIGSAPFLRNHGINPVIDNPFVGENLQDQVTVGVSFELRDRDRDPVLSIDFLVNPDRGRQAANTAISRASSPGPPAHSPTVAADITLSLDHEQNKAFLTLVDFYDACRRSEGTPNRGSPAQFHQYTIVSRLLHEPTSASAHYTMSDTQHTPRLGSPFGPRRNPGLETEGRFLTLFVSLVHPFSRGSVHIASANPADKPVIDMKYLNNPLDLDLLARHLQTAVDKLIYSSSSIVKLLKPKGRTVPSDLSSCLSSLEGTKELVKSTAFSGMNTVGTCAMMAKELGGVVDAEGRVYGIRNLRVADASIIPMSPGGGGIVGTVYAGAEKLAEGIRRG
ncbi:MAG: hypothetical protein M1835_000556 [Candelina submexicana]|nr:MAG: hypothetical protein M1835_000556 [Candelina submexicana]